MTASWSQTSRWAVHFTSSSAEPAAIRDSSFRSPPPPRWLAPRYGPNAARIRTSRATSPASSLATYSSGDGDSTALYCDRAALYCLSL